MKLWSYLRPYLARCKKALLNRPVGLGRRGAGSAVRFPRTIRGRRYVQIGARSLVLSHSFIHAIDRCGDTSYRPAITIGDDVYIGRYVYITSIQGITIADGCVLSEHVYITDLNHGFDPEAGLIMKQDLNSKGPVLIGPHCFLGYRVAVMPGVVLGERCVVGANSVVTRSFPAYSMIAGVPARLVKVYSHERREWLAPTTGAVAVR